MPALTTLDLILLIYFAVTSIAIVVIVFYLEKFKNRSSQLTADNQILSQRQALLQNQLSLIQQKYESGHRFSELESIFTQIDTGVILINSKECIANINPAAEQFLDVSKNDVLTKHF